MYILIMGNNKKVTNTYDYIKLSEMIFMRTHINGWILNKEWVKVYRFPYNGDEDKKTN